MTMDWVAAWFNRMASLGAAPDDIAGIELKVAMALSDLAVSASYGGWRCGWGSACSVNGRQAKRSNAD